MKKLIKYYVPVLILIFVSCSDDHKSVSGSVAETFSYYTPDGINSFLDGIKLKYPDITSLETVGYSESGRVIRAIIISDNPSVLEGEPSVRIAGGIHGNELAGIEVPIRFIEYLTSNYESDSTVKDLVNGRYICIIPLLNPDGRVANTRYNKNSVDLNRNFNDAGNHWEAGSHHGSEAFSESETRALRDFSIPKHFTVSISYHTGAVLVNTPFDFGSEAEGVYPVQNVLVKTFAKAYTKAGSFLSNPDLETFLDEGIINGGNWYIITGSLQDWSYTQSGCLDLTIEVAQSSPDEEDEVQQIFLYNRDSLMAYIKKTEEGVHGRVINGSGNPVSEAQITVSWDDNGTAVTGDLVVKTDINGYYNLILLPGTYSITCTADLYQSQTANVEITSAAKTAIQNITLVSL